MNNESNKVEKKDYLDVIVTIDRGGHAISVGFDMATIVDAVDEDGCAAVLTQDEKKLARELFESGVNERGF